MCKMIFGPKGRLWGVCNTPLPENMNTRRVSMFPCRGVLHTPHRYPVRGKRKAFDDQMCKMIFGPKGRLWGVCNTPLLGNMKTQNVWVLLLGRKYKTRRVWVLLLGRKYKTRRVWVSPCRGVLHTPHGRSIYGTMNHDNWHGLRIRHPWDGVRRGVCNTPLRWRIETRRVCGMSPSDTPQTKQPDTFTHAGLHSHSDGRAVHSQK